MTTTRFGDPDRELLGTFGNPDYADAFRVPAVAGVPAIDWARACLASGSATSQRLFGGLVWGGALGFDLRPANEPGTLVGWTITTDLPSELVMDTDGARMAGRIVFVATDAWVTWTTMIRYHGLAAGPVWSVCGPVHRLLAERLLGAARRRFLRRAS